MIGVIGIKETYKNEFFITELTVVCYNVLSSIIVEQIDT